MMPLTRLSPQVCARILQRTQRNIRKFENLGIDSHPDTISLENCEYVAKLLAIEAVAPGCQRTAQDRDIVLRVCDQFIASGTPALKEWAIAELNRQQRQLQEEIRDRETASVEMLERLISLGAMACN